MKLVLGLLKTETNQIAQLKSHATPHANCRLKLLAGFVDRRFLTSRFSSCMLPLRTPHASKVNDLMMAMVPVTHPVCNDLLRRASAP